MIALRQGELMTIGLQSLADRLSPISKSIYDLLMRVFAFDSHIVSSWGVPPEQAATCNWFQRNLRGKSFWRERIYRRVAGCNILPLASLGKDEVQAGHVVLIIIAQRIAQVPNGDIESFQLSWEEKLVFLVNDQEREEEN